MGVFYGTGAEAANTLGSPLIGYDNVVTATNIASTTEAAGSPVTNLANSATHLIWEGTGTTADEDIIVTVSISDTVDYLGIAGHNFGTNAVYAQVEGLDPAQVRLHFDRDGSSPDVIVDSNSIGSIHVWTANGNANESTVDFKFGGASLATDGTGDYVATPDHADFILGSSEFTIDFWFKCTAAAGSTQRICGQWAAGLNDSSFNFTRTTGNIIDCSVSDGVLQFTVTGTTQFTSVTNTGWHHAALVRSGNTLMLFIDGVQEGGTVAFSGIIPNSSVPLEVGRFGGDPGWIGFIDEWRLLVGAARWTAAFTVPDKPSGWTPLASSVASTEPAVLLHFDGTDTSTTITDSAPGGSLHTWSVTANAQLDNAQFRFGSTSCLFDGAGDRVTIAANSDFKLGSGDFTIDCWFQVSTASVNGTNLQIAGQCDNITTNLLTAFKIERNTSNFIAASVYQGSTSFVITGTTAYTNAANLGWHHLAFVRTGNILKLFIDGTQQSSNLAFTGAVNETANNLSVGRVGEHAGGAWHGWIDEFRMTIGTALWTTTFTPPTTAHAGNATGIYDDSPIIWHWVATPLAGLRLHMRGNAPSIAVMYAGELLVMERSIKVDVDHVPITYGRRTSVVSGMSETGNFLGRIVIGEYRESKAEFAWFTPEFYRSDIDPFLDAARSNPFFWAWHPNVYPLETGYAWLTKDAEPEVHTVTQRIAVTLEMRGVA